MIKILIALGRIVSLSWRLFVRTIGAKYRKSFLGYFWMIAPALIITGGVTLASKAGIINPGSTVLSYPLFVFFGTLLWQVFAEAFDVGHKSFEGARTYITRVYFPREAIILAQFYESLITTGVRLLLAILLLSITHGIDGRALWIITSCFAGSLIFGLGAGTVLMPFTLLFADLHNTIKLFLNYGLFLTPAMYLPQGNGFFATVVRWNPVSPLMNSAREAAAGLPLSQATELVYVLGSATLLTVIGFILARITAPIVIERMLMGGR